MLVRVGIGTLVFNLVLIGRSMCQRPHFTALTTRGGTEPCRPMKIIFGGVIKSWYISLNIKFSANRTFHVLKTPIYRFNYYEMYRALWTDEDNFW